MSQPDKDQRVELPEKFKQNTPRVFGQILLHSTWMVFHLCTRLIHWTKLAPPKEEYGGSNLQALHKGVWQKVVNQEWEEK